MILIKAIQIGSGVLFAVYVYKGLLGRFKEGDWTKAIVIGAAWLAVTIFQAFNRQG